MPSKARRGPATCHVSRLDPAQRGRLPEIALSAEDRKISMVAAAIVQDHVGSGGRGRRRIDHLDQRPIMSVAYGREICRGILARQR